MPTKTKQLEKAFKDLLKKYATDINEDNLNYSGPQGGKNAARIIGWTNSGNQTITKACHAVGIPTMPYWSGSAPTPSRAVPNCMFNDMEKVYNNIFK